MDFLSLGDFILGGSLKLMVGVLIGFAIGLTGVGGGVLLMPALTLVLGMSPVMAVGTANLFNVMAKSYAFFEHFKLKTIRFRQGSLFLLAALPGSVGSALLLTMYLKHHQGDLILVKQLQESLRYVIAGVILLSLAMILFTYSNKSQKNKSQPKPKEGLGIFLSFFVGILIGVTSVGGGAVVVPILLIFFGLTTEATVGTSIFIALVLMASNSLVYGFSGQTDVKTAFWLLTGSLGGIALGSRLAVKISEKSLRLIVIAVIFISAILMFFKGKGH